MRPTKNTLVAVAAAVSALTITGLANASERIDRSEPAAAQAAPRTLIVRSTQYGRVLFDGRGRVLYGFTRDRRGGPSRCYGACARAWPVYFARGTVIRVGPGVKKTLIGKTRRRDGRLQFTYNGWPLYYYTHDGPGEVRCQNVDEYGGLWLVVRPNGTLVR
jgi:predicted lipoprotein with Yx(FWY)xxD motif